MIESCNGTIDGSILPFSLPPFPFTAEGSISIFRKNFYFEFYDEVETIFHRDVRAERDEERKKKKRGKGNARARQ